VGRYAPEESHAARIGHHRGMRADVTPTAPTSGSSAFFTTRWRPVPCHPSTSASWQLCACEIGFDWFDLLSCSSPSHTHETERASPIQASPSSPHHTRANLMHRPTHLSIHTPGRWTLSRVVAASLAPSPIGCLTHRGPAAAQGSKARAVTGRTGGAAQVTRRDSTRVASQAIECAGPECRGGSRQLFKI
jgi:hypothetical protein